MGYYNEAGEKLTEQNVAGMLTMLSDHMYEHTTMSKQCLEAHHIPAE